MEAYLSNFFREIARDLRGDFMRAVRSAADDGQGGISTPQHRRRAFLELLDRATEDPARSPIIREWIAGMRALKPREEFMKCLFDEFILALAEVDQRVCDGVEDARGNTLCYDCGVSLSLGHHLQADPLLFLNMRGPLCPDCLRRAELSTERCSQCGDALDFVLNRTNKPLCYECTNLASH